MEKLHTRIDWCCTQKLIEFDLIEIYRILKRAPKIREIAEKYNWCERTVKLHKPFIDLQSLQEKGIINQDEKRALSKKWQGKKVNSIKQKGNS